MDIALYWVTNVTFNLKAYLSGIKHVASEATVIFYIKIHNIFFIIEFKELGSFPYSACEH